MCWFRLECLCFEIIINLIFVGCTGIGQWGGGNEVMRFVGIAIWRVYEFGFDLKNWRL